MSTDSMPTRDSTEKEVTQKIGTAQTTTQMQDAEQETPDDAAEYPGGAKLGLIILALCLAVFLMALE
jgi:hypothetical protein